MKGDVMKVIAEFKGGGRAEIPITEVDTANKLINLLDEEVLCERLRLFDNKGFDVTDQRYDLE